MSEKITLTNALLTDPSLNLNEVGSIVVENGLIVDVIKGKNADSGKVIDLKGQHLTPGFIDLRCELGEPGYEQKETMRTGTDAAAAGGFTTLCLLPMTQPVNDSGFVTQFIQEKIKQSALVSVFPMGSISQNLQGQAMASIDSMLRAGCIALTDGNKSVMNAYLLRKTMEYLRPYDIPVVEHCEDVNLVGLGVMNEGAVSSEIGLRGIPATAEDVIVSRDISLCAHARGRLHFSHLSSKGAIESLAHAKARGLKVTADVSPMHLLLTEENLRSYETSFKLSPPLRTELDRKHLIDALRAGVIDCIASDHSPQSEEDKDVEFESAAPGASSLEITWGATYELVKKGELQLSRAIEALTFGPSKVMGFKDRGQLKAGLRGDFTVFQVGSSWKVSGEDFYSKSKYTPFEGCTFNSQVTSTFVSGHQVYDKEIGVLR